MDSYSDASQAGKEFQRVRDNLVYKDEDVLETGMQKVQPLQYLDEEILKHRDQISDSISEADQCHDGVPSRLLSQVNQVIKEAEQGQTTLYKASALLDFTSEAFLYARQAAQDTFDLSRTSREKLAQYDTVFTKMMEARLNAEIDQATECQDECVGCLESAVEEAEKDVMAQKRRSQEEEEHESRTGSLEDVKLEVQDSIRDEMSELQMIKTHCATDLKNMESGMNKFKQGARKEEEERSRKESKWRNDLKTNRQEQERLRKKLQDLEDDERRLELDLKHVKEEEQQAKVVVDDIDVLAGEWQEKIKDLQSRVETSIKIMTDMKDITDTIVHDAMDKQRAVRERLSKCELEGVLASRDALMAHGVMCMLIMSDCETNIKSSNEEIVQLEKDKKVAAKTMNKAKINSAVKAIEEYELSKSKYESTHIEFKEKLQGTRHKLQQVEQALKKLKPLLKLDSMQDRFKERSHLMDQVFENEGVAGIVFKSTKPYKL